MRNPNNNNLVANPNTVNPNAPNYYQLFAVSAEIHAVDKATGQYRQYDVKDEAAFGRFYGRRNTLNNAFNQLEVVLDMAAGAGMRSHEFRLVFDNWVDVLALLQNTTFLN